MDHRLRFLIDFHVGHVPGEDKDFCPTCGNYLVWSGRFVSGDDAVNWAIAELEAGNDGDALRRLSALTRPTTWREVVELFRQAYGELGYAERSPETHLRALLRLIANQIIGGSLPAVEGCREISYIINHLDWPEDLDSMEWQEMVGGRHPDQGEPVSEAELREGILRYARRLITATPPSRNTS